MAEQSGVLLEMEHICKRFGHITALDDASIRACAGRVLAIIGDNGAGKSTLIKMLSGVLAPDSGVIRIDGKAYSRLDTRTALQLGISTVYQDLALGDTMDVASNLFLGDELTRFGILRKREMERQARELLEQFHISIPDVRVPVGELSGGQRQCIAVARLLRQGGRMFVFDEPTAAMGYNESLAVLRLIRRLSDSGYTVLLISHNFIQVLEYSDDICVMRHGRVIANMPTADATLDRIADILSVEGEGAAEGAPVPGKEA